MNLKKYFKIWLKTSFLSLEEILANRGASLIFVVGKIIRFSFFIVVLFSVLEKTKSIKGFDFLQMINFFLIFNLLDIVGQLFFRGIYLFRQKVVTGRFDLTLAKPISPLFQALMYKTDFLDFPLLLIILIALIKQNINISLINFILFLILFICALSIIFAIHVFTASIGIITTEVDHSIWIYRDLSRLARVPVDIYTFGVRAFLTFIIPIALIFTFPAKALMGILSWEWIIYSLLFAFSFSLLAIKFWRFALTKYSSASS